MVRLPPLLLRRPSTIRPSKSELKSLCRLGYVLCFPIPAVHLADPNASTIGHVNNVQYLRYSETSRIWYFRRLAAHVPRNKRKEWDELLSPKGEGLILKSANVDFLFVSIEVFLQETT